MPAVHRPGFDAFRKESELDRDKGTKYRGYFMWPYINQEDLLNTKTLPLLLNARGRYPPSHFAAADIDAIRLGVVSKAIVPIFLNEHVMILNGFNENTREYGKLLSWNDHPDAFDWMFKQIQFLPGEGLVIMEAQARLLNFLVQCCLQLLHEIPESNLTSDSFPVLPEPQLKPESEITGFESLGVMASEAPYRVPAQLDLSRIESLLAAKASAAEDHLWALREDPGYFTRTLLKLEEHHQEMLKDLHGKDHPVRSHGRQESLWARIIGSALSDAYLELEFFSEISNKAKDLISLQRKYADNISPSKGLPEEYLEALLRFQFYLNQGAKAPLSNLKHAAVASPPLRSYFFRQPPPDPHTLKIMVQSKPDMKAGTVERQLLWLLRTLWEDEYELFLATMPLVMDELERLLQSEPRARELVSSYIAEVIGDLSIISQCLNQLSHYQPFARTWESELVSREDNIKQDYARWAGLSTGILTALRAALPETNRSARAVGLGEPSGGKFTYPINKRRTKEIVEALRRAEGHLDAFWAAIDQVMVSRAGKLHGTAVRNLLSQGRILQRTPEWADTQKPQAPSAQDKVVGEADPYAYLPISTIYSGLSAKELDIAQPKTKVKTRGTPKAPAHSTEAEALLHPNPADPQPTFSVDARALKVFRTAFFNLLQQPCRLK